MILIDSRTVVILDKTIISTMNLETAFCAVQIKADSIVPLAFVTISLALY